MNRIITISREFGSGVRELGKRLADALEIPCYDHEIIDMIAEQGDCVIVGRCADIILRDMTLFVYADQQLKLARYISRAPEDEELSSTEMNRKMRQIDQDRAAYRDAKWEQKETYHLCINTSGKEIKNLIPPLVGYSSCWFGK